MVVWVCEKVTQRLTLLSEQCCACLVAISKATECPVAKVPGKDQMVEYHWQEDTHVHICAHNASPRICMSPHAQVIGARKCERKALATGMHWNGLSCPCRAR